MILLLLFFFYGKHFFYHIIFQNLLAKGLVQQNYPVDYFYLQLLQEGF